MRNAIAMTAIAAMAEAQSSSVRTPSAIFVQELILEDMLFTFPVTGHYRYGGD